MPQYRGMSGQYRGMPGQYRDMPGQFRKIPEHVEGMSWWVNRRKGEAISVVWGETGNWIKFLIVNKEND